MTKEKHKLKITICRLLQEDSRALQSHSQSSSEAQAEATLARMQAFAISESRAMLLDGLSRQAVQESDDVKDVWLSPFIPMPVSLLLPKARVCGLPINCPSQL